MDEKILLVMTAGRRQTLLNMLERNGIEVVAAEDAPEALSLLTGASHFDAVIADAELARGSWRDLIPSVLLSETPCEMIVCSRCGDERLWAEVLQWGAYDLIPEPYVEQDTLLIVRRALDARLWRRIKSPVESRAS